MSVLNVEVYMKFFNKALVWSLVAFSGVAAANVNDPHPFKSTSANKLYVATAGEVMLTFLSKDASYSDDLFLQGSSTKILNNQTALAGQQFSLGSFQAGAELAFKLFVNDTHNTFYSGFTSNNADNSIHTVFELNSDKTVIVGFEDLLNGGDKDFNDVIFKLSNVSMSNVAVAAVPEPLTVSMILTGLFMFAALKRRQS